MAHQRHHSRLRDLFRPKREPEPRLDNSIFGRLPDRILDKILRLAMKSDYPFMLEGSCPLHWENFCLREMAKSPYVRNKPSRFHDADDASIMNRADWLLVNSTCFRFRRLGIVAFFEEKVFILSTGTLRHLYVKTTNKILPTDLINKYGEKREYYYWDPHYEKAMFVLDRLCQGSALRYIRHIYLVDPSTRRSEIWLQRWLELPIRLSIFHRLSQLSLCHLPDSCAMEVFFMGNPGPIKGDNLQRLECLLGELQGILVRYGMSKRVGLTCNVLPKETGEYLPPRVYKIENLESDLSKAIEQRWDTVRIEPLKKPPELGGFIGAFAAVLEVLAAM